MERFTTPSPQRDEQQVRQWRQAPPVAAGGERRRLSHLTNTSHFPPLGLFQLLSGLEILHAAVGLAGASPFAAALQWLGRSNILFGVVTSVPEVQPRLAVGLMLAAWSSSEVIRYPWYAANLAGACPFWLTWLR
jgi:hypothetical protein